MPSEPKILALYTEHRGQLVNYANRILGDRAHAEDVVQEAYLRCDAAAQDRAVGEPLAYLYRVVRNLSLDVRRRLGRELQRHTPTEQVQVEAIPDRTPSQEAGLAAREELLIISDDMAELPERARVALEMHRFGGCSFKEIRTHLDISTGLAHSLVVQALEHCRERLYRRPPRRKS